jgi:hypothetical protein
LQLAGDNGGLFFLFVVVFVAVLVRNHHDHHVRNGRIRAHVFVLPYLRQRVPM